MYFLAQDYHVLTWESRGLFAETPGFDHLASDVVAQVGDLFAVMDHAGVEHAHLMGLCGGAVIALAAAATQPTRVTSLSLWHGDYELGANCPKTDHQHDLKALMIMAAESRESAESVRTAICHSMSKALPDLAHLVLYPYANAELMFRYGKLNGAIMDTDARPFMDRVTQPVLVVTAENDATAHPAGSRQAAERLANAVLRVEPHGDHISLFHAGANTTRLLASFLARMPRDFREGSREFQTDRSTVESDLRD